jgi:hypothetical protein
VGRRDPRIDGRAVPMVWAAAVDGVLPANEVAAKGEARAGGLIKALIGAQPSFGYRTAAGLLGMNKNTVQRIFQRKGWQVRERDG